MMKRSVLGYLVNIKRQPGNKKGKDGNSAINMHYGPCPDPAHDYMTRY